VKVVVVVPAVPEVGHGVGETVGAHQAAPRGVVKLRGASTANPNQRRAVRMVSARKEAKKKKIKRRTNGPANEKTRLGCMRVPFCVFHKERWRLHWRLPTAGNPQRGLESATAAAASKRPQASSFFPSLDPRTRGSAFFPSSHGASPALSNAAASTVVGWAPPPS
jgi:hypothetical protein